MRRSKGAKMENKIKEIVLFTLFYEQYGSGTTSEEIETFEDRAFKEYLHNPILKAKVSRTFCHIQESVDDYLTDIGAK
jgi:hypothetical protein